MPSSSDAYILSNDTVYHGDLAPLFTIVDNKDLINSPVVALCIGNSLLKQILYAENAEVKKQLRDNIKEEYRKTLDQILKINIRASKIILVTPPYDADPNIPFSAAERDAYHDRKRQFMQSIADIIKELPDDLTANIIIADLTSSINPFNCKNYTTPTELSPFGVGKVKRALEELLNLNNLNHTVQAGKVYRFHPRFLTTCDRTALENEDYLEFSFSNWKMADPYDLKMGYSFKELQFYQDNNLEHITAEDLLTEFHNKFNSLDHSSPQYSAACLVHERAATLLKALETDYELKNWKMSMGLALEVLKSPNPHTFAMLEANAKQRAFGKNDTGKLFSAGLLIFCGCMIMALAATAATVPVAIGALAAGSLFCATGLTMFYKNIHFSNKDNLHALTNAANDDYSQLPVPRPV
jgi:hypothetical protein